MVVTTLSKKHQMTVPMEIVKMLGLVAGMRFKQWVEGNRIVIEPIPDVMSLYGSLSLGPDHKQLSPKEEEELMEAAVTREVMGLEKDAW